MFHLLCKPTDCQKVYLHSALKFSIFLVKAERILISLLWSGWSQADVLLTKFKLTSSFYVSIVADFFFQLLYESRLLEIILIVNLVNKITFTWRTIQHNIIHQTNITNWSAVKEYLFEFQSKKIVDTYKCSIHGLYTEKNQKGTQLRIVLIKSHLYRKAQRYTARIEKVTYIY